MYSTYESCVPLLSALLRALNCRCQCHGSSSIWDSKVERVDHVGVHHSTHRSPALPWCAVRYHLLLELLQRKGVAGGTRVLLLHVLVYTGCVRVGAVLRGGVPPPLEGALIVGVFPSVWMSAVQLSPPESHASGGPRAASCTAGTP